MSTGFEDLVGAFVRAMPGAKRAGRDPRGTVEDDLDLVHRLVMALDDEQRAEFLVEFAAPWRLLIVCHCDHPNLAAFCGWVQNMDGIILLAGADGPPPPAVMLFKAGDLPNLQQAAG